MFSETWGHCRAGFWFIYWFCC